MTGVVEAEDHRTESTTREWLVIAEDNRWPQWVFMRLYPGESSEGALNLHLTINFDEYHLPLFGSRVTYGLTGGDLRFHLTGGEIPYSDREPRTTLEIDLPVERTVTAVARGSSKATRSAGASMHVSESKGKGSAKLRSKRERQKGIERQTADKFPHTIPQVTTKGSEAQPIWSFEIKSGDPVLKGRLERFRLGSLYLQGDACRIKAIFETKRSNILISGGDGFLPDDLCRNKYAIIDTLLRIVLAKRLRPFLSLVEVRYG